MTFYGSRFQSALSNKKKNVFNTQPANASNTDAKPAKEHMYMQSKKKNGDSNEKVIFTKTKCTLQKRRMQREWRELEREGEGEKETEIKERDLDHRETRYNNFIHHFLFSFFFGHHRLEVTKVHSLSNASTIDCTHKYRWHKCVQHVVPLCMEQLPLEQFRAHAI